MDVSEYQIEYGNGAYLGHWGQGLSLPRATGGLGSSSKFVTDLAPCRMDVPMQSFPVSPPPMTITSLPLAFM